MFKTAITQAGKKSSGAQTTVILGILLAIWSASGGMVALETALDVAYEVPKSAKFIKKRLKSFVLILCTVVFGGLSSIFIVEGAPLGHSLSNLIGFHGIGFTIIWTVVRWVLTIILVSLLFSCYYYFGPNREIPSWKWVSPGGVVGTIIFLVASLGFSFYVSEFGNSSYSKTYGSLAGVALLIFWLYLAGIAVLLGGEINAESERQAAAEAGHPGARQAAGDVEQGAPRRARTPHRSSLLRIFNKLIRLRVPARRGLTAHQHGGRAGPSPLISTGAATRPAPHRPGG